MEKGTCERRFDVRIQIKLQGAGEGEGVGNDNEIGLERSGQMPQSTFLGEVKR